MTDKTFSFAVDDELMTAFDAVARTQHTSSEELLRQLMHDFVAGHHTDPDYDAWFMQQVEGGIAEADAGNVMSSEEVEAYFSARRDELLACLSTRR